MDKVWGIPPASHIREMKHELFLDWTCLSESLDTEQLITLLGFTPELIWKKGDLRPKTTKCFTSNGFRIRQLILDPQEKDLIAQNFLEMYFESIKRVRDNDVNARINFTCAVYSYESEGIFLEPKYIQMLAETKSEFNYDLTVWDEKDEDDVPPEID